MAYEYKAGERETIIACGGDEAKLAVAVAQGKVTFAGIMAHSAEKALENQPLSLKVGMSDKGCIHVSGINGKWGVALYPQQWVALLAIGKDIIQFGKDNEAELTRRGEAEKARKAAEKAKPATPPMAQTA